MNLFIMFRKPPYDRLDALLSRLVDGMASADDGREIDEILRYDPAARERYRVFLAAHLELASHPRELPSRTPIPQRRRVGIPLAAAAAVALATGVTLWRAGSKPAAGEPSQALVPQSELPVLAVASRVEQAVWDLEISLATGATLASGPVNLTAGVITFDLINGQKLTIQAPARFELINDREMRLHSGDAALRVDQESPTYIIQVPGGAVVDLGTEISLKVGDDGIADVRVFEGEANASVVDFSGRTRQERLLRAGESVRISETLERSEKEEDSFLRSLPGIPSERSPAGETYAAAVMRSAPLAWWRFDRMLDATTVAAAAGGIPLRLEGVPRIVGPPDGRFLFADDAAAPGFAMSPVALSGLDSSTGFSVECLIFPTSESHCTAIALDRPDLPPPMIGPLARFIKHPPQRLAIERAGIRGSRLGHIHPDFALRAMLRSPAGYEGGTNTYSNESHLLHRWIHVVFTRDGSHLRLYLDGRLSDQVQSPHQPANASLRPIIGRMQPLPSGEARQWHGGIDEVALYGRALGAEEIATHAAAMDR